MQGPSPHHLRSSCKMSAIGHLQAAEQPDGVRSSHPYGRITPKTNKRARAPWHRQSNVLSYRQTGSSSTPLIERGFTEPS